MTRIILMAALLMCSAFAAAADEGDATVSAVVPAAEVFWKQFEE